MTLESLQKLLLEMPVGDVNFVGKWNDSKNLHGYDRPSYKMLTNPNYVQKIKTSWMKFHYDVDMFFVKDKNLRQYSERGEVDSQFIKDNLGLDIHPNYNIITMVYVNNMGDEKVPLTPWILAHRMSHAIMRRNDTFEKHYEQVVHRSIINDLLPVLYPNRVSKGYSTSFWSSPDEYRSRKDQEEKLTDVLYQLCTFRSARNNNVRNLTEFLHEMMAQYVIEGHVTFNKDYNNLKRILKHMAWGRPYYKWHPQRSEEDIREIEHAIENLENLTNHAINDVFGDAVDKIFLM
jgi:hypothetical protein